MTNQMIQLAQKVATFIQEKNIDVTKHSMTEITQAYFKHQEAVAQVVATKMKLAATKSPGLVVDALNGSEKALVEILK